MALVYKKLLKFKLIFAKYSTCHNLMDSQQAFSDQKLDQYLGFYGEQGGELQNEINKLYKTCGMKPNSRRLLNIQKEHHRRVRPEAKVLNLHMQKKRKKKILQWPPVEII